MVYKKPTCDCGNNNLRYIALKLNKSVWEIEDDGQYQNKLIRDEPIDTEDEYLICTECGLKHLFELDEKGRIKR